MSRGGHGFDDQEQVKNREPPKPLTLRQPSKAEIECQKMSPSRLSQAQTDPLFEKASFPIESATPPVPP